MKAQRYFALKSRPTQVLFILGALGIGLTLQLKSVGFSYQTVLIDVGSLLSLLFLMANLTYTIQRYYHSQNAFNTTNSALILLFSSATVGLNLLMIRTFQSETDALYSTFYANTFVYRLILILGFYALVLLLFWVDQQILSENELKIRSVEKEREAIQIEMNSIQQQFKPHFLFNSLNSINALTLTNPEEARTMIQLLSEFMRGSVRQDSTTKIKLREEIQHLKLYTDIEKVRFGDRLTVTYSIPETLTSFQLPPLILQPIIENAIKYGLYGNTGTVAIHISATQENNYLVLVITNPYDTLTQQTSKGTGYGLRSIERKMLLIYGQSNLLQTTNDASVFKTTLRIPQA